MPAPDSIFRLLIVDDDPLVCELLTLLLQKDGFVVNAVTSGEAALQALRGTAYSAVLTDLQMPGTDGLELARRIRCLPRHPLVLGMSARDLGSHEAYALDGFLHKPFTAADVRSALTRASTTHQQANRKTTTGSQASVLSEEPIPKTGEAPENHFDPYATALSPPDPTLEGVLDLAIFSRLKDAIGSPQLAQLYEMTAHDVEARLLHMHTCLQIRDLATLQAEAHAIKGGCAMVGAVELSHLAAAAETRSETDTAHLKEMANACIRLRQVVTIVSP